MYATLSVVREEHLTWLTLNRPDALNALSRRMVDELRDFFWGLADDRDTRVVVVRGAGRGFCAGLDLKETGSAQQERNAPHSVPDTLRGQRRISEVVMLMRRAPQPIIAAVHGAAAGGGFAIALASDVRVAGQSARMNAAFIRLGLSACDIGVSYFLPRIVGASVALGAAPHRRLHRRRARRANRAGVEGRARRPSSRRAPANSRRPMLRNAPLGLRLTKECLKHSIDAGSLRAGDRDGGSQPGPQRRHARLPRRRRGVPREAAGSLRGRVAVRLRQLAARARGPQPAAAATIDRPGYAVPLLRHVPRLGAPRGTKKKASSDPSAIGGGLQARARARMPFRREEAVLGRSAAGAAARGARVAIFVAALVAPSARAGDTLALLDVDGEPVTLAPTAGRPLVVHFWATWCPSCRDELGELDRAASACSGVDVVAVNVAEDAATVAKWLGERPLRMRVLRDPDGKAWRATGGREMPANAIWVGAQRSWRFGPSSAAAWREQLAALGCQRHRDGAAAEPEVARPPGGFLE